MDTTMNNYSRLEWTWTPELKESLSTTEEIMTQVRSQVFDIIAPSEVLGEFMEEVNNQRDSMGRKTPRTVRAYIHALLPELKNSRKFIMLKPDGQKYVLDEISKLIHKK